jgi:uncharacterized protein (TIGR03067 family)
MRRSVLLLAVATVSVSLGAGPPAKIDPAVKAELKKLRGRWLIVRMQTASWDWDARDHARKRITTITGYDWGHDHPAAKSTIVAIDAKSKAFDLVTTFNGVPLPRREAIYKVEGDALEVSLREGTGNRPTGFDRPTESGCILVVFRRLKEK